MPVATPAAVRKQIESGSADPVYLLQGEDDVEKSALAHEFEELVEEGLRAFNVERIHAGDMTTGDKLADGVASLVAAARTLPMMAPRRVVIVLQAEALLVPKRESEAATRALDELEALLKQPEPQTTLVLVAGALDKRSRMYKLLAKQATVVECGAIEDQADAERWVRTASRPPASRSSRRRRGCWPSAAAPTSSGCATTSIGCCCTRWARRRSRSTTCGEMAGPAALQDDWAMTNAIEAGDGATALRQLALMLDAGAPPEKILGQLGWLVRTKFPAIAPRRAAGRGRGAVPDGPRPEDARPAIRGSCSSGWWSSCARGKRSRAAGRR